MFGLYIPNTPNTVVHVKYRGVPHCVPERWNDGTPSGIVVAMRYVSLFSGIGGIDLGLDRAGMTCVCQVENDPYCQKVLAKHWPDVPKWGDIKTFPSASLRADVDMVAGGFPCQPVSKAGKMRGDSDERFLWPEMYRVCKDLRPRYILVENVIGLLSTPDGMGRGGGLFGGVVRDMASLGYCVEWHCIPASSVNALHKRDRVWIVAHSEHDGSLQTSGRGDHRGVQQQQGREEESQGSEQSSTGCDQPSLRSDVPDTYQQGLEGYSGDVKTEDRPGRVIEGAFGPVTKGSLRRFADRTGSAQWGVEPDVGRVADGVPSRMDRLRSLGNGCVPQVVEFIGRIIMEQQNPHQYPHQRPPIHT